MKTFSVLLTMALLLAANQLAARLERTGALPAHAPAGKQSHERTMADSGPLEPHSSTDNTNTINETSRKI